MDTKMIEEQALKLPEPDRARLARKLLDSLDAPSEMVLTDSRDQAAFVEALLNPPAPGHRLRRAIRRYRKLTGT
jgi:uncharacterized protein (DUF1778 family)